MKTYDISNAVALILKKNNEDDKDRPIRIIQASNAVDLTWDELKEIVYEASHNFNEPLLGFDYSK